MKTSRCNADEHWFVIPLTQTSLWLFFFLSSRAVFLFRGSSHTHAHTHTEGALLSFRYVHGCRLEPNTQIILKATECLIKDNKLHMAGSLFFVCVLISHIYKCLSLVSPCLHVWILEGLYSPLPPLIQSAVFKHWLHWFSALLILCSCLGQF